MTEKLTDSRLANLGARSIHEAFSAYRKKFDAITRQAKIRFRERNWHSMRADATDRLELYKKIVDRVEAQIRRLLAARVHDKLVWTGIKAVYSGFIGNRNDWELAETFFNSVTRRIFATIGVDPNIEFVDTDFETPPTPSISDVFRTYGGSESTEALIETILSDYPLVDAFQNLRHDAKWVAAEIENHLRSIGVSGNIEQVHMVENIFYRGMGAYIIGRFYIGPVLVPVAIALLNTDKGIIVDGVLLDKNDLVFKHDRAGRLVDAQAFEHLQFDACCFSDQLLDEFQAEARQTVQIKDEQIIVEHAYVERRVIPLNVYLEEADADAARNVVIDFGGAIKDMAVSNIFPGDILLKNFGVTRHGRVVFYDYDELCTLTSCNFKKLPQALSYDDELSSEPWFYVDENDVFPEEFRNFIGLREPLREVFMEHHADLFDV